MDNQVIPSMPPQILPPCFQALPPETTERAQWFMWRAVWNSEREKFDKVPFIPHTEDHASSTKKYAWRRFDVAKAAYETGKYDGVGFAIENTGLVFVDLDDVYDPTTGEVKEWAAMLIRKIGSYTEFSPSLTGFHILAHGQLPAGGRHELEFADGSALEAYDRGRYTTVTGAVVKLWPDLDLSMIRSYDFATLWQDHAHISLARPKKEPKAATEKKSEANGNCRAIGGTANLRAWLNKHGIRILAEKREGGKVTYEIECQGSHGDYEDKSDGKAFAIQFANGAISYGCQHSSCSHYKELGNHWKALRSIYQQKPPTLAGATAPVAKTAPWKLEEAAEGRVSDSDRSDASSPPEQEHSASVVSPLPEAIRSIALDQDLPAFDKRRNIMRLIQDYLTAEGECFHTSDGRGFFFHESERHIYDIDTQTFERLVAAASGLSLTEAFFRFAIDQLRTHVLRNSRLSAIHTLAHFRPDSGTIAVSDGASGVWIRERGGRWEECHNGEDGLFFTVDDDGTSWRPEFGTGDSLRWFLDQLLFANYELSTDDSKTLILVWLLQQFFPELRRTRVVPCFLGPQGSGKSTAGRMIGRLIVGPRFDVTGIRGDKEDAFVAAVTNRVVFGLDNADSRVSWLPDALATYATGQRYRLRKLYTTNEELAYTPRSILLISSRDPRFNRPDVTERLLPLHFERPALYRTEAEIFGELELRRGAIMGALLLQLGEIADALANCPAKSLPFRMADFASFGERVFASRGNSSEFIALLTRLEKMQARFAAEGDGLVEALRLLLEEEAIEHMGVGDLFKKCRRVADDNGLPLARNAQGFGRHLNNMRRVIEIELQRRLVVSAGHAGSRRISLVQEVRSPRPILSEDCHGTS